MKAKILTILISFIFLCTIYSNTLYAVTNEIIEDTQQEEILEDSKVQEVLIDETDEEENSIGEIDTEEEIQEDLETDEIQIIKEEIPEITEPIEYQGKMNIEIPTNLQTLTRPNEAKLKVQGWAVSNDNNATVRVLLDGNVVANNLTRVQRPDVDRLISPSYGGTANTPKAGFNGEIDITNQSAGNHKLRIEEISRFGAVITSSEITIRVANQNYQGKLNIEIPTNLQTLTRPNEAKLKVQGWAVSNDNNATVRVLLDGNVVANNLTRVQRPDVDRLISPSYGGTANTPKAGFNGEIDITNQSAGNHKLRIEEISRFGAVITSSEITIRVANQNYQGKLNIEIPTNLQTLTRPHEAKLKIQGWAVSNDNNATIRVLLDGNIVENNLARVQRPDVDRLISPSYGRNSKHTKSRI